jgi:hypothetical protein
MGAHSEAVAGHEVEDPSVSRTFVGNECVHSLSGKHSVIHQWLYCFCWALASSSLSQSFTRTVGLLGRVIRPPQGRYLHTGQHKHRINAHTDIHAVSGSRTHDPSVRASEDSSCLRQCGHCDRRPESIHHNSSEVPLHNSPKFADPKIDAARTTHAFTSHENSVR